ncbi:MAG TPA: putative lipid II flippase FtsW [Candidatus Eisenbacteria bacterium]|jgi:cell division protein FtsW|nr:putative lipid II flippase FtsW [Candidatus Eisenbacteria bacterium]
MFRKRPDHVFLALLGALVAFGLVMLTSASGPLAFQRFNDPYWFVKHQLLYGLLPGTLFFLLLANIDYRAWRRFAPHLLVGSLVLLLLVFLPGLGAEWGTSKSWIRIGGFSLQPVEIVKLFFLLYLAALLERRGETETGGVGAGLVPFLTALAAIAVLLMLQPDLGSLLVIAAVAFAVYFIAGAPWLHIVGILAAGAAALALLIKSAPYRTARLMTFLHPELDPQGVGYHINQAFLAIGSGGWFGLGLGHSRQKYLFLPEVAGDSVFAVIAEELGFIFMLAVVALIVAFVMRMVRIARQAPDPFGKFAAMGIASWVFFQTLFNIGSMLGIMPMTGLPLPFISYGGTSMAVLLGAMGVLANISAQAAPESVRRRRE